MDKLEHLLISLCLQTAIGFATGNWWKKSNQFIFEILASMDKLEHLLISLCLQAVIGFITGNWWAGAAVCAALWIGREQAQAEYRWIAWFGDGKRENLRWWNAFDSKVWNTHNFFWNLSLPIVAVTIIGVLT